VPLFVRGGSVIALSKTTNRPDYDYTDGVEMKAFGLKEGETVEVRIPHIDGSEAACLACRMFNGELQVQVVSGSIK
jgi:alpha-D-xyloside xylohydrolase